MTSPTDDRPEPRARVEPHVRPAFERQRRNLLGTSVMLALYLWSGVSLSELNILGNRFPIERSEALPLGIGIAWLYFGLRYWQHWRDLDDRAPTNAFLGRLGHLVWRRMRREFEGEYPASYWHDGTITNVKFTYESPLSFGVPKGEWNIVFSAGMTFTMPDGKPGVTHIDNWTRSTRTTLRERALSHLWVAFNTRHFTEYTLPVIVALAPAPALLRRLVELI